MNKVLVVIVIIIVLLGIFFSFNPPTVSDNNVQDTPMATFSPTPSPSSIPVPYRQVVAPSQTTTDYSTPASQPTMPPVPTGLSGDALNKYLQDWTKANLNTDPVVMPTMTVPTIDTTVPTTNIIAPTLQPIQTQPCPISASGQVIQDMSGGCNSGKTGL